MNAITSYILSKKFTEETASEFGALKGASAQIQSIVPITGGNRITFVWENTAGETRTETLDVIDGKTPECTVIEIEGGHKVTFTIDGQEYVFNVMDGVKGDKGDKGDTGEGIPTGGTTGQVLVKKSSTDYDTEWDTPAGGGDMLKSVYDTDNDGKVDSAENADTVDGHTVAKDVPADAVFTDTVYDDTEIKGEIADKVDKVDGKGLSTNDYTNADKAIVDGVTSALSDKVDKVTGKGLSANDFTDALKDKLDDIEPNAEVNVQADWSETDTTDDAYIANKPTLGTASAKDSTDRVSPNNTALVESQSVYSAINTALSSIYTPRGDITCAELTSELLISDNVGNIYEVSDSGTTTALFLQGAGVPISAGTNVGIISAGQGRILFNLMANAFDLTSYQKIDLAQAVEGETTVEDALGALSTKKASKVSSATNGNFAGLDANGNLTDSGKKPSDFQTALTFDNAPTENSNNPVKSGGVYSADDKIYQVMGQNSAKNFIPFDLDRIKAKNTTGTWNGNVYSLNGIDFTFNSDGTVDASGTATETASVHYYDPVGLPPFGGDRILRLTGCPSGGSRTTYKVMAYRASEVDGSTGTAEDYGDGISLRWLNNGSGIKAFISISVYTEAGTIDVTFKPMLRLSTDTDNTYQPYAKTNQELTSENQTLTNNVDVLFETGVKNICPPYSGSFSANGITYIGNSDGTVTVNGTCSANVGANVRVYLKAGQYKVSGCPRGGSYSTYRIGVTTDSWTLIGTHDHGNGTTITIPSDDYYRINLDVRAGYVANNLVFKPMITDVDTPESDYDHYVPYAKTNQQLTEDSIDWDNFSELGAVNVLENKATSGTRTDGTTTFTYTVNADKSVTISAPSYPVTVQSVLGFNINNNACVNLKANKVYRLSGCPEGGSFTTYYLALFKSGTIDKADSGNGYEFIMQSSWTNILVAIQIKAGTVLNNALTFKPMITSADYEGDYVTYARSNTELTQIGTLRNITVTVNPDYATDGTLTLPSIYLGNHYWLCTCQPLHIKKGIDIAALISTHANVITLPSGYSSGISMKAYYIVNDIANMGMFQLANRWNSNGMQFYAIDSELNTYIKNASADLYMATITSFIVIRETT